jgi:heme exporter protein B
LLFLRQVWAIVLKDIAAEFHTREIISAMLVFAMLALLIFSFALDLRGDLARAAAPGVLWATLAFAGTLGLNRALAREQQSGCIDGLLLAPAERSAILLGKMLGNLLFLGVVEVVLLPLCAAFFNVPLLRGGILGVTALGTLGYTAAGTLLASIAMNTRAREVMLPILLLPLTLPALVAAVQATGALLEGARMAEVGGWVRLLVIYDLVILAVSVLTFDYVVEA